MKKLLFYIGAVSWGLGLHSLGITVKTPAFYFLTLGMALIAICNE